MGTITNKRSDTIDVNEFFTFINIDNEGVTLTEAITEFIKKCQTTPKTLRKNRNNRKRLSVVGFKALFAHVQEQGLGITQQSLVQSPALGNVESTPPKNVQSNTVPIE